MSLPIPNECFFVAAEGGTVDFVVSRAYPGFYKPSECVAPSIVDGVEYYWRAEVVSAQGVIIQQELSFGAYEVATQKALRTTIIQSSNANQKVNFSAAPRVRLVVPSQELGGGGGNLVVDETPIEGGVVGRMLVHGLGDVLAELPITPPSSDLVVGVTEIVGGLVGKMFSHGAGDFLAEVDAPSGGFELVTADRTYFVRDDGSDSNDGLTNTAGGAFLTVQHAVDVVTQTIHMKKCIVEIDGNGFTYDESVYISTVLGNGGEEYLAVLKNVIIAPSVAGDAVLYVDGSYGFWLLQDLTLDASIVGGNCLYVAGSNVDLTGTINLIGATSSYISLFYRSYLSVAFANIHLFGTTCNIAIWVDNNSYLETFLGTSFVVEDVLLCGQQFLAVLDSSIASFGSIGGATTFAGTVTGQRFTVGLGSHILTPDLSGGPDYIPGDVAGTVLASGIYDGARGVMQKAGAVVAGDIPAGTWQVIQDTVGATQKIYANIGGVLKSVALT